MLRVALTGNIASGKSTVLALFRSWGATVIDLDEVAREVVAPGTPALAAIAQRFGRDLILENGMLDRAALRRRVMGEKGKRDALNALVHPEVLRRTAALTDEAARRGDAITVVDIPLLFENADPSAYHVIVLVDAPPAVRRARLIEQRGLAPEEADVLLAAQLPSVAKRAKSHFVIDNDGAREALEARAGKVWEKLVEQARQFA